MILTLLLLSLGCGGPEGNTDQDGDGYQSTEGDCDDTDDSIYPGAAEIAYDGIDQDCNGSDLRDRDQDGHEAQEVGGEDCDDNDATIYPGAPETLNDGIDQDCDGDLGVDADNDGFAAGEDCDDTRADIYPGRDPGVEEPGVDHDCDGDSDNDGVIEGDCDPADGEIYPGAEEVAYDGVDQDCDGVDLVDVDGDGFAGGAAGDDCDDGAALIYPGAEEIAYDDIDQDCDGSDLVDVDGDGFAGGDGGTDCNDGVDTIYPGAPEIAYDDIDQDCDGSDGVDPDQDGFCSDLAPEDHPQCTAGRGDCNENDGAIHPGAIDLVDGVDNDCNGLTDDGITQLEDNLLPLFSEGSEAGVGAWLGEGDFNGDGAMDLIATGRGAGENGGALSIWLGPIDDFYGQDLPPQATITLPAGWQIGSQAEILDLNGDGNDDIALGVPADESGESGQVVILLGRDGDGEVEALNHNPLLAIADLDLFPGGGHAIRLGASLASGDINDDGVDDLLVGAPSGKLNNNLETVAGMAYVVYGTNAEGAWVSERACVDREAWTDDEQCWAENLPVVAGLQKRTDRCVGPWQDSYFGQALEVADFDGDGADDYVVAASALSGKTDKPARLYFWMSGSENRPDFCGDSGLITDVEADITVVNGVATGNDVIPILGIEAVHERSVDPIDNSPQAALAVVSLEVDSDADVRTQSTALYLLRFRKSSSWPVRLEEGGGGVTVIRSTDDYLGPLGFSRYDDAEAFNEAIPLRISVDLVDIDGDAHSDLVIGSPYLRRGEDGPLGLTHIFLGNGPGEWPDALTLAEANGEIRVELGEYMADGLRGFDLDGVGAEELMIGTTDLAQGLGQIYTYWGPGPSAD